MNLHSKKIISVKDKKDFRKKLLKMVLYFFLFFALYQLILQIGEKYNIVYFVGIGVYIAAASVLFCAYYAVNGFKVSGVPTKYDDLPSEWSEDRKNKFLEDEAIRMKKAKGILTVLLPMIVTILINYIALYSYDIFGYIKSFFNK